VEPVPTPIALRLFGQDHALEPGRDYVLGSAEDCDLRLGAGAAPHHARLRVQAGGVDLEDLGSPGGTRRNGEVVAQARLQIGDVLRLGADEAVVVPDAGLALVVPLPAMRQAARARRLAAVRAWAAAHRFAETTFADLVAQELRRAPWLGASLLLHGLLLLLLWFWLPQTGSGGRAPATAAIVLGDGTAAAGAGSPPPPEVLVEPPEPENDLPPLELPPLPEAEPAAEPAEPAPGAASDRFAGNPRIARAPGRGGGEAPVPGSSGFRRTVGELRKSGLEIVFVFDSTGSMGRAIHDTRNTIVQLLAVLRALVPDARVGLVTYRDRSPREAYLVREIPLGPDFWRAANFVHSVGADGGGDRAEDVRAGLGAAFAQPWQHGTRRVVVLAGDAPPHDDDQARLLADVRAFAADGRSFVHALVVSPGAAGDDTRECFARIARAGRGTCLDLADHEGVMQLVVTLAFGREYDRDIAAMVRTIEANAQRTETWALDLARRGGPALAAALRQAPVDHRLLNALVRLPRRGVAAELIDLLAAPATPPHARQAIAWALQRAFDLPAPPIDPVAGEPPGPRDLARLRRLAARLPE